MVIVHSLVTCPSGISKIGWYRSPIEGPELRFTSQDLAHFSLGFGPPRQKLGQNGPQSVRIPENEAGGGRKNGKKLGAMDR